MNKFFFKKKDPILGVVIEGGSNAPLKRHHPKKEKEKRNKKQKQKCIIIDSLTLAPHCFIIALTASIGWFDYDTLFGIIEPVSYLSSAES